MGCEAGQRLLINDRKPSKPFLPQAVSYEIERDAGLSQLEVGEVARRDEFSTGIIERMPGNSFAKTYLINKNGKQAIRKHIVKSKENLVHYERLKRQYNDLKRLYFLNDQLVPEPIGEHDSYFEYFYDIEYLDGYKNLSSFCNREKVVVMTALCQALNRDVYSLRKTIIGKQWMENFMDTKILPKLLKYQEIDEVFHNLINARVVKINGHEYWGLKAILEKLSLEQFYPKHISPVHGDLSLENVMYNGTKIKVIDMDGSNLFDAPEQDLGKLAQSIISRYHLWDKIEIPVSDISDDNITCDGNYFELPVDEVFKDIVPLWFKILDKRNVLENAIFYMSCYFIRFVPFRLQKNLHHGYFALIMSIVWLNKLLEQKE